MNRDVPILHLAATIRSLIDQREEASARVAEIDAVLDDCRRALAGTPERIGPRRGSFTPAAQAIAAADGEAAAVKLAPVVAALRCACRPGCDAPLPTPAAKGGRRFRYAIGHAPSDRARNASATQSTRTARVDPFSRGAFLGRSTDEHEVVFSGRGFKDGRGLSGAIGHSTLHGESGVSRAARTRA